MTGRSQDGQQVSDAGVQFVSELAKRGIKFRRQVSFPIVYDGLRLESGLRLDLLVAGLVVGLIIGLFQALTQIQEQTIAVVPKIVGMILVLMVSLPWLVAQMLHYTTELIGGIPGRF